MAALPALPARDANLGLAEQCSTAFRRAEGWAQVRRRAQHFCPDERRRARLLRNFQVAAPAAQSWNGIENRAARPSRLRLRHRRALRAQLAARASPAPPSFDRLADRAPSRRLATREPPPRIQPLGARREARQFGEWWSAAARSPQQKPRPRTGKADMARQGGLPELGLPPLVGVAWRHSKPGGAEWEQRRALGEGSLKRQGLPAPRPRRGVAGL